MECLASSKEKLYKKRRGRQWAPCPPSAASGGSLRASSGREGIACLSPSLFQHMFGVLFASSISSTRPVPRALLMLEKVIYFVTHSPSKSMLKMVDLVNLQFSIPFSLRDQGR